jgi:hypothetical protein
MAMNRFDGKAWRRENERAGAELGLLRIKFAIEKDRWDWNNSSDSIATPEKLELLMRTYAVADAYTHNVGHRDGSFGSTIDKYNSSKNDSVMKIYGIIKSWKSETRTNNAQRQAQLNEVHSALDDLMENIGNSIRIAGVKMS